MATGFRLRSSNPKVRFFSPGLCHTSTTASPTSFSPWLPVMIESQVAQTVKNLLAVQRPRFNPWVGKISWRRKWLSTPVFLPGQEEPGGLDMTEATKHAGTYMLWPRSLLLKTTFFKVFIELVIISAFVIYILIIGLQNMCDLTSPTRAQTQTPCTGRCSLNHWTTR